MFKTFILKLTISETFPSQTQINIEKNELRQRIVGYLKEIIYHLGEAAYLQSIKPNSDYFQDLLDSIEDEKIDFITLYNQNKADEVADKVTNLEELIDINYDNHIMAATFYANELKNELEKSF